MLETIESIDTKLSKYRVFSGLYSVRMPENTDLKKSVFRYISHGRRYFSLFHAFENFAPEDSYASAESDKLRT